MFIVETVSIQNYEPLFDEQGFIEALPAIVGQKDHIDSWDSSKNATLVCMRFGLGYANRQTLTEIGTHFGVSAECVRKKLDDLLKVVIINKGMWLKRRKKPYGRRA